MASARRPARGALVLSLLSAAPFAAPALAAPSAVRFPAVRYAGGASAAAHESVSGDPSDAAAARRRAEILRSPYVRVAERRAPKGADVVLAFDNGVPAELRDGLGRDLPPALAALAERDGWARPSSAKTPLLVEVVSGPAASAAGWDGRERDGTLRAPVVLVSASGRPASAVVLDVLHQAAVLCVRQAAPDEAGWAAEGVAEWAARRAAGLGGVPVAEDDPFQEETGHLQSPPTLAAFLDSLEARLPRGAADVREAWETAGAVTGDEAEAFLADVAARAGSANVADVLVETVAGRLASAAARRGAPAGVVARRSWLSGPVASVAPPTLGWGRASLRMEDERGGVEVVPPGTGFRAGRALVFYRGDGGDFDGVPLVPGQARLLPAAGVASLQVVLAGGDGGDAVVRVRRVPDYPASVAAAGAEWTGGAVVVSWSTARHKDLLGWVVERRDEDAGVDVAPARETVPAASESPDGTAYVFADRDAKRSSRYRYRVLALTTDGLLSEAFETRVETR